MRYDLVIIGADTAGIEAAIVADEMLLRVAIIETEASSALQSALALTSVDRFIGNARFIHPREIAIQNDRKTVLLQAEVFIIATGSRSARPAHIPFDGETVLVPDEMQQLQRLPQSLTMIGGNADGFEQAMRAARCGANVTIVDSREQIGDEETQRNAEQLLDATIRLGIDCRFNAQVIGIEKTSPSQSTVQLAGGQRIASEVILYSAERVGNTESLNLDGIGVETDERCRLWCNDDQQTWIENIYGVGDVVGFPRPPQRPAQQGQHVVRHAFNQVGQARHATFNHPSVVPPRYECHQATAL